MGVTVGVGLGIGVATRGVEVGLGVLVGKTLVAMGVGLRLTLDSGVGLITRPQPLSSISPTSHIAGCNKPARILLIILGFLQTVT